MAGRAAVRFYRASVHIRNAGADTMDEVMIVSKQSAYFKVPRLDGNHQIKKIKQGLDEIPGVLSVSANDQKDQVAVDYDSSGTNVSAIERHLRNMGVDAQLISNRDHTM